MKDRVKIFGSSGRTFWPKNFELKSYSFSESRLRFFRFEKLESRFLLVEIFVGVIKSFDSKFSDRVTIALIARLIRRLCSRSPYFVRLIFWNCRLFFFEIFCTGVSIWTFQPLYIWRREWFRSLWRSYAVFNQLRIWAWVKATHSTTKQSSSL